MDEVLDLASWVKKHLVLSDGRANPQGKRTLLRYPKIATVIEQCTPWAKSLAAAVHCILNNITQQPTCYCGQPTNYVDGQYYRFCTSKCARNSEEVRQASRLAILANFADPIKKKQIVDSRKEGMKRKYGVEHALQSPASQKARQYSLTSRFGTSNTNLVESILTKRRATNQRKYGHDWSSRRHWSDDIRQKIDDPEWLRDAHITKKQSILTIARQLGVSDKILGDYYHKANIPIQQFYQSQGEKEVAEFVGELGIIPTLRDRALIYPNELDIYVPEHNLAIEYCGLYWHSEKRLPASYHKTKLDRCLQHGVRLITLFEDEWLEKSTIVKSKIAQMLRVNTTKIGARECTISTINNDEKTKFLNQYHIQGDGPSTVAFGLKYNDRWVAVMSFVKRKQEWNLTRYATSCSVPGGFSRLVNHFITVHKPAKLISFADRRWSEGDVYLKNGFKLVETQRPDYYWIKGEHRYHKFGFRHVSLKNKLKNYDPSKSEAENCRAHGYLKLYNCGLLKFELS